MISIKLYRNMKIINSNEYAKLKVSTKLQFLNNLENTEMNPDPPQEQFYLELLTKSLKILTFQKK